MRKLLDLSIAFTAGALCTWIFAAFIGPFSVAVSGTEKPVIVRVNKLSGRTEVYTDGWKRLK